MGNGCVHGRGNCDLGLLVTFLDISLLAEWLASSTNCWMPPWVFLLHWTVMHSFLYSCYLALGFSPQVVGSTVVAIVILQWRGLTSPYDNALGNSMLSLRELFVLCDVSDQAVTLMLA